MITSGHDPWNACYGGELCMLAAITQHLVADSAGHTGGGRPHEYITHTLSTSHNQIILTHFLSVAGGMSGHVFGFGGRRDGMRSVSRHWLLVFGHYVSSVCGGETGTEREKDNKGTVAAICLSDVSVWGAGEAAICSGIWILV